MKLEKPSWGYIYNYLPKQIPKQTYIHELRVNSCILSLEHVNTFALSWSLWTSLLGNWKLPLWDSFEWMWRRYQNRVFQQGHQKITCLLISTSFRVCELLNTTSDHTNSTQEENPWSKILRNPSRHNPAREINRQKHPHAEPT